MKRNFWPNLVLKICLTFCGISLLVLSLEIYSFWKENNRLKETAKNNAKQEAVRASKQLEEKLQKIQEVANGIARDVTAGKLTDEQLLDRAKKDLEQNRDFLEVGAIYKPFAYNPRRRLYAPYYTRKNGKIERNQIENYYDYTVGSDNDWYYKALENGSLWNEPDFDKSSSAVVADYFTTFSRLDPKTKQQVPAGLIYANLSLNKLKNLIDSLDVGKSGYGFLLSHQGLLLAHPNQQYVKDGKTIFDLAKIRKNQQLQAIGENAIAGKSTVIDLVDMITGEASWVFLEPISLNGWSLAVVVIKDDTAIDFRIKREQLIRIALEAIAFLFFLSIIVVRADRGGIRRLWAVSCTFSILVAAGIGFIWYLVLTEESFKNNRNLLLSRTSIDNFLEPSIQLSKNVNRRPIVLLPTGVFIQSVKFNTANDVFLTGYVWQKYEDGVHDGISRGFIMPEGYEVTIDEAYRYKNGSTELIGWYFEGTLRQNFDFSTYPFDNNDVWIRLWPKDFNQRDFHKNVILVPDLTGYDVLNPVAKPGLENDFVSENWEIESSFFEYKFNTYNTNFGFQERGSRKDYPELYFTIIFKRAFIGVLIAKIVPLTVVGFLIFIMLLLSRERSMEVVGACSGFIFILILDQISMRGQVAAKGIIYFEFFYFAIYLFILLVAMNAILLNRERKFALIEYKNNLIPKLLYWPSIATILLIVTVLVFY